MLRLQGAQLVEVPAVPYANPNNYVKYSGRLAERLAKEEAAGAIWANQFDNLANRQAHIATTGPEIIDSLGDTVDGFVCACVRAARWLALAWRLNTIIQEYVLA